ncbi:hypothetical protein [Marinicella gelatinilytica]|uniref:hypothetical protein n=1 Tax=Marinicella gelatinilytica TaxID=2996017 RepID=UPI002260DF00|nr:hypothetical protein [Marinicella gelatinilytica]MCX7545272.1 hypothetical protein [Marinicella gelatinilytica]
MKTQLLSILGAGTMFAGVAVADTTLIYGDDKGQETTRMMLTADVVKVTTNADANADVIFDGNKTEFVVINHDEKSFMVFGEKEIEALSDVSAMMDRMIEKQMANIPEAQREQMRGMMESMIKSQMPEQKAAPTYQKSGATKEYNGYSCDVVEKTVAGKTTGDFCVTDYGKLDVAPGEYAVIAKFMKIAEKMASQFGQDTSMNFDAIGQVLPVYFKDAGQTGILMDVNNDKLDAALLTVPEGYKQQSLPEEMF